MRVFRVFCMVIAFAFATTTAGASMLSLLDTTGNTGQVDVPENLPGSFTVNIRFDYTAPQVVNGMTFFLHSYDSDTAFAITGRNITGLPMSSGALNIPITGLAALTAGPGNILAPENARDLGLLGPAGATLSVSGTIMTVTLSHAALPAGDYRINVDERPVYNDLNFEELPLTRGGNYIVHVVPEPATIFLLSLAGILVLSRAGRSR